MTTVSTFITNGLGGNSSALLVPGFFGASGGVTPPVILPGGIDITALSRLFPVTQDTLVFNVIKRPAERLVGLALDFRRRLARHEILTSGSVSSPDGITSTFLRVDSSLVVCAVAGGSASQQYMLTLTGYGSMGSVIYGGILITDAPYIQEATANTAQTVWVDPVSLRRYKWEIQDGVFVQVEVA